MPGHTEYETGARHPVEKKHPDANEEFSQDAAANKRPPPEAGDSETPRPKPAGPHPRDVREDPSPNPNKGSSKNPA